MWSEKTRKKGQAWGSAKALLSFVPRLPASLISLMPCFGRVRSSLDANASLVPFSRLFELTFILSICVPFHFPSLFLLNRFGSITSAASFRHHANQQALPS